MTQFAQALSAALLHFVWQGLLVAGLLWAALWLLRERSANARYLASCFALGALVLLPAVTSILVFRRPLPAPVTAEFAAVRDFALQTGVSEARWGWLPAVQRWALPIWAVGVLLFSLRLLWAWRRVSALRNSGEAAGDSLLLVAERLRSRLEVTRPVRIVVTLLADGPAVIGWLRPVVLLPAATLLQLTPEQLESVLAHEFAHIRRHDYLVNLLQTFAETLLFYHPVVWWTSGRIRHERELCCDDAAVNVCGDALCYARALASLERMRLAAPALSMGGTGGSLLYRIQRLAGARPAAYAPSLMPGVLALVMGALCLVANMNWAHGQETARGETVNLFRMLAPADRPGVTVDTGSAALLHRTPVEYPEAARQQRIQGTVVVEVTLAQNGTVGDAHVVRGPAELRKAALEAVLQWHFAKLYAGSTQQVAIAFDAAKAEAPEVRPEVREEAGVTRSIGLAVVRRDSAEPAGIERPMKLAGSVLAHIQVDGLSEDQRRNLLGGLPVHLGDLLTENLIEKLTAAVRQFDEHLEVNLGVNDKGQAELHIVAPNSGGVFEMRSDRRE